MPTPYLKKVAKKTKTSVKTQETKFSKAKALAKKQGKGKNFSYITAIYKKIAHQEGAPSMSKELKEFRTFIKKEIPMNEVMEQRKAILRNQIIEMTTSSGIAVGPDVEQDGQIKDVIPAGTLDGTKEDPPVGVTEVDVDPEIEDSPGGPDTRDTGTKPYDPTPEITQEDLEVLSAVGEMSEEEFQDFFSKLDENEQAYLQNRFALLTEAEEEDSGTEVDNSDSAEGVFYKDDGGLYDVEDDEDTADEIEVDPTLNDTEDGERGDQRGDETVAPM